MTFLDLLFASPLGYLAEKLGWFVLAVLFIWCLFMIFMNYVLRRGNIFSIFAADMVVWGIKVIWWVVFLSVLSTIFIALREHAIQQMESQKQQETWR